MEKAFDQISEELKNGEIVCIFPEGIITYDGKVANFRAGIEKIIERNPVPVIPMALEGLWGSFFSRKYGPAVSKFSVIPKRIWSQVRLNIDAPFEASETTALKLEMKVKEMMGEKAE